MAETIKIRLKTKFIIWFHSKFPGKYCWADCVGWVYSDNWNPFKVSDSEGCKYESLENEVCYCGAWRKGICFDTLPPEEKARIRKERSIEVETAEPPF